MRFPGQAGLIAGLTLTVGDLARSTPFWRGLLHPLGYGRTNGGPSWCLWAREGAQILIQEGSTPSSQVCLALRAPDRATVDRLAATLDTGAVIEPPEERPFAPGYYSAMLADPDGIRVEIVHALQDLPERRGGVLVQVPGADGISLGGYLFRPSGITNGTRGSVICLHGYGGDARHLVDDGRRLAEAGLVALCLSQRGWLGSTGTEDQGFRQPDDIVSAAGWLREQIGPTRIGLLGYSQGGQVALLAAARPASMPFAAVVSYFACTDLAAWAKQSAVAGIADYLADFVPVERLAACSPVTVADRIACPALLVHGAEDDNVPVEQARIMMAANPRLRLRIVDGAGHGTPPERWAALWPETLAFLKEHLLPAPSREPND